MVVSRLTFHTLPNKTHEVEQRLQRLQEIVSTTCHAQPRILRAHFASLGAPDIVFEQDAVDLPTLESQIQLVAQTPAFQEWSSGMTGLLREPPKRELYALVNPAQGRTETMSLDAVAAPV